MVETENSCSEYARMSIRDRNFELFNIFDYLFGQLNIDDIQLVEHARLFIKDSLYGQESNIKNRAISIRKEHPEIFVLYEGKLDELLPFAEITPHFQSFIKEAFQDMYFQRATRRSLLGVVMNLNRLESGGIFDSQQAKKIERAIYEDELHHAIESRVFPEYLAPLSREYKALYKKLSNTSRFATWRREFIDRHGEAIIKPVVAA